VHRGNFVVKGRVGAIDVFEPQAENKVNESATIQAAIALLLAMSLCFVVPKDAAAQSGTEATASQGTQSPTKEPPKATTPKKNARLDKTAKPDAAVAKQAKPDGALKTDAGKTDAVKSGSAKVEGTGAGSSDGLDVPSARNRPATPATATTGTREFVPRKAPAKPTPAQPAKTSASDDSKPSGK